MGDVCLVSKTAMSPEEQTDFLTRTRCIAKISTLDEDGTMHMVPVWYMYDGQNYVITSDAGSHHVKNLRRDNRATVLIDTVQFPTKGVRIKGRTALEENGNKVHSLELEITRRYISDAEKAEDYVNARESKSRRVAIIVSPEHVSNWDYSKDTKEKEFFKDSPVYSLSG